MDTVTKEAREELQKLVAAQAGASYESADKLKACGTALLASALRCANGKTCRPGRSHPRDQDDRPHYRGGTPDQVLAG